MNPIMIRTPLLFLCLGLLACGSSTPQHGASSSEPDAGFSDDIDTSYEVDSGSEDAGVDDEPVKLVIDPTAQGWISYAYPRDGANSHYATGTDPQVTLEGARVAFVRSTASPLAAEEFGTRMSALLQSDMVRFRGRRIRMSTRVKTELVADWAGLWLRIDGAPGMGRAPEVLNFDNMSTRPIKGTTAWKTYEIVLDVPTETASVVFGVLMVGTGTTWFGPVTMETVDESVPVTAMFPAD
jgi:hypothetical protein